MQILPQQLASTDTTSTGTTSLQSLGTVKQAALFASLLSGMATSSTTSATQTASTTTSASSTTSSAAVSTLGDPLAASKAPTQQELMNLPLTREDIAALHDELTTRGFSETEISGMQAQADTGQGMTWGELVKEVKKKVSSSENKKTEETSSSDQAQLLGLFGKLGFTADESQQLLDSLAKGDTEAVWGKVKAKVAGLGSDTTVSLDSSEIAALGKQLNLSQTAQDRLTALFDQSNAAEGLSLSGLQTALSLIENELSSQLAKESQSLEDFKKAATPVLAQAWEKNQTKKNSDLHDDDVARKAGQAVALGGDGKSGQDEDGTAQPISKGEVDVTADLPKSAQTSSETATTKAGAEASAQDKTVHTTQTDKDVASQQLQTEVKMAASDKQQETGTHAKETAGTAETPTTGQEKVATHETDKQQLSDTGNGSTGNNSAQQQTAKDGEGNWGDFWSKVRSDVVASGNTTTATTSTTGQGQLGFVPAGLGATDGAMTRFAQTAAQMSDSGLAGRAAQQLETGLLKDLGQGIKQLTLTLNPEELGNLSVTLTVKDKEVRATITADNPDTAAMLQEQASKIKQHLENQGLKVSKLDVQTSLAQDNQSGWQSPEQHNMAREQRETMDRLRTSMRLAQLSGGTAAEAESMTVIPRTMTSQSTGLDLFT